MNNEDISFVKFIKKYDIKIPIIQRDYVQGRKNAEDIRENFVETIFDSLQSGEELNLEFIYGNIYKDNDGNEIFEPIDGQQRLTTLYLVTLFLALREKNISELEELQKRNFSYEVRNSSKEFCSEFKNNLISEILNSSKESSNETKQDFILNNIKEYITNQKWYDEEWKHDQTIQSMLEMLQTIQDKYNEEPRGELYSNLEKYINFKFINTEDDELEEDTYIKLNARGIKLSIFEKYKASFLEYEKFREAYSRKIDGIWNDWIWKKINLEDYKKDNTIFDKAFYGIFRAILTNEYAKRHKIINYKTDISNNELDDLINEEIVEFTRYKKLMQNDIEEVILDIGKIFDFLITTKIENTKNKFNKYIDLNEMINKQLIPLEKGKKDSNKLKGNLERCEFYAICLYAIQNYSEELNEENYIQWTRIARNLIPRTISSNSEYTIIINNLYDIYNKFKESDNYLETFSKLNIEINDNDIALDKTFKKKTKQEIIKAKAMLINNEWKNLIQENDENKFLAGETNFLLDFCGISEKIESGEIYTDESYFNKYKEYTKIKNIIFPKNEKKMCEDLDKSFGEENEKCDNTHKLLTRALLAISEWNENEMYILDEKEKINKEYGYLISMKNCHYSFLSNSYDRDYGWRNIFKEENKTNCLYFKILMNDMIKENVDTKEKMIHRLNQIIKNSKAINWKKYFIDSDDVYYLMNNGLNLLKIESFEDNKYNIFILNGKNDNSKSLPLFFVALDKKAKKYNLKIKSKGENLTEAWTVGLYYNLDEKKIIDEINDKECLISMSRDETTSIVSYYKDISNLNEEEKQNVDEILKEIEEEFQIEFLEENS